MTPYELIINASKITGYNLERVPNFQYSLRKSNRGFPVSISENEFEILREAAKTCKNCVEISTGTGVSSIALSSCYGTVVSIDSYAEEMLNSYSEYKDKEIINNNSSDYNMIKDMHKYLNIENIKCEIGWSPRDVPLFIKKHIDSIDLLFIDSGHFDYQLIADLDVCFDFLSDNFKLFIHDAHCFSSAISHIEQKTNRKIKYIDGCLINNGGWNLCELA